VYGVPFKKVLVTRVLRQIVDKVEWLKLGLHYDGIQYVASFQY
jgi:hypothetical protein